MFDVVLFINEKYYYFTFRQWTKTTGFVLKEFIV